jgi:hypothetical protein
MFSDRRGYPGQDKPERLHIRAAEGGAQLVPAGGEPAATLRRGTAGNIVVKTGTGTFASAEPRPECIPNMEYKSHR